VIWMTVTSQLASAIASWFGCGRSPVAPGTVGTLGTLPLYFWMREWPGLYYWATVAALCIVGVWASQTITAKLGQKDPGVIVIDEVTGTLIALGFVRHTSWPFELAAVCCFRVFDITKPGPVAWAERARPAGLGVMADDWVAGLLAGALCGGVRYFYGS
jgi:phosphatidylglycerophosphatase A